MGIPLFFFNRLFISYRYMRQSKHCIQFLRTVHCFGTCMQKSCSASSYIHRTGQTAYPCMVGHAWIHFYNIRIKQLLNFWNQHLIHCIMKCYFFSLQKMVISVDPGQSTTGQKNHSWHGKNVE